MSQPADSELSLPGENREKRDNPRQRLKKNVQLLFIGLGAEEIASLLALLRTSRTAPRGRKINSEKAFLEALSERSWDIVICASNPGRFGAMEAVVHLKRLDKDIPVIQIIPEADCQRQLRGFKSRIHAIVPQNEKELLVLQVRKELENLENRRKLRRSMAALAEAEKRNLELMDSSKNAIAFCNDQHVVYANESFYDLFGESQAEQVLGRDITEWFTQPDRERLQTEFHEIKNGTLSAQSLQLTGQRNDQSEFVANLELRTNSFHGKEVVQFLLRGDDHHIGNIFHDDLNLLTGHLNRDFLLRQLERVIPRALSGGNDCSLLYLSLDQYEPLHTQQGQDATEQFIREVGSLLQSLVNKPHLLSHVEKDAFAIVFFDSSADKALQFAEKIAKQINRFSCEINNETLQSNCSIGITLVNDSAPPAEELLSRARTAATEASSNGNGSNIALFSSSSSLDLDSEEMRRVCQAVETEELRLLFQPIVSLAADNKTDQHYEVLLRLLDADDIEISPNEFRNAMRDPETVVKVDRWVIEHSLLPLKETLQDTKRNILFINISVHGMGDKNLLSWLSEVLEKHQIPAEQIVFQISNSDVAMAPKQARFFAKFLHKIHCRICIKHFGSAPYDREVLKKVDADYIKLDGAYIQELGRDSKQDQQLSELVRDLSSMGKITIAPLVEDTRSMVTLWKAGVSYVQGYYLQPPLEQMDYDFFAE